MLVFINYWIEKCTVKHWKNRKYSQTQQLFISVLIQRKISVSEAVTKLVKYINIDVQSHREI